MAIPLTGMIFLGGSAILADGVLGAISNESLLPGWAEGGILLAALVAFLTDKIKTGTAYNQAIKERDAERKRTEEAEMIAKDLLTEKVFPALIETQLVLRNVSDAVLPAIEKINARIDELDKFLDQVQINKAGNT